MQCWSCGFENLPGLTACARCASRLELAQVAFEPPRASPGLLRTRVARRWYNVVDVARECREWLRDILTVDDGPVPPTVLAWSLLPGWGQICQGYVAIGGFVFALWLVLGVLALLMLASQWQSLFVTLMVVLHTLVVFTLLAPSLRHERVVVRVLAPLVLWFIINYMLYGAVGWAITRFARPVPVSVASIGGPTVRGDDGLLVEGYWLRPRRFQRGALVLFEIPYMRRDQYIVRAGVAVDRILGLPGEHVTVSDGQVLVDGALCPVSSLMALPPMGSFEYRLGADEYLIVPTETSMMRVNISALRGDVAEAVSVVPQRRVLGRVLWRIRSLSHWERLE